VPELPEVERARSLIEAKALGRRIADVDDADTWVCRPHAPGEIAAALSGATLVEAHRRGKAMWVETDDGPALGIHLGMAGRIVVDERGSERGWDRFTLRFEDGGSLALRDKRRLGRVVLAPDLSRLGPDAAVVTRREFRERIGRGRAPVKARIMDQSRISGVGNLLADEALWRARVSPLREAGSLSEAELDELRRALRFANRRAIERGGVHTGDLIAQRRGGGRCPRCGAVLERSTVGGRTTWWCPVEQPSAPAG
jgi:formamidopyrimidine-DNA glycosylase